MTTIKVQIPVSPETIEREVQLPAYRKDKYGSFFKVVSEKLAICIVAGDSYCISVNATMAMEVLTEKKYFDCSKEEFEKAFEQVLDRLSNLQITHA